MIKKKYVYLMLCIAWMGVIFWFSMQEGTSSQGMSNRVFAWLDVIFHTNFRNAESAFLQEASFIVRKSAHISEYAILALLYAAYLKEVCKKRYIWIVLLGVFFYACSDEIHQIFVPERSAQLIDVGFDMIGGSIGVGLHIAYVSVRKKKERSK